MMTTIREPVLAITPDSDRMHVGPAATVLSHVTAEQPPAGGPEPATDWEFHDADGRALAVTAGGLAAADAAAPAPLRAVRDVLVSRIDLVLAHAQLRLDAQIAQRIAGGDPPTDDERVRMLRAGGELADVLGVLVMLEPGLDPTPGDPTPGSWWHYFWAH